MFALGYKVSNRWAGNLTGQSYDDLTFNSSLDSDEATIQFRFTVSSVDVGPIVDSAEVYLNLQVSGTDDFGKYDEATVYLDFTPLGGECYATFSPEQFGEGEADPRWYSSQNNPRWLGTDNLRWSVGEILIEGINC